MNTTEELINEIRCGRMVVLIDDEDISLRIDRDTLNARTGNTMRGSGDHHSTGRSSENQGNTPWR